MSLLRRITQSTPRHVLYRSFNSDANSSACKFNITNMKNVTYVEQGKVVIITINRPERRNAVGKKVVESIYCHCQ